MKNMSLMEKLSADMVASLKSGAKDRLTVLRMIKAGVMQEHIDHKRELEDDLVIDVVGKQIKMRNDSLVEFEKANRTDLVDQTKEEIAVLKEYLPEQLSKEEVAKTVEEAFAKVNPTGAKDMGKIMQEVSPKLKGKADMKEVSSLIKEKLENL